MEYFCVLLDTFEHYWTLLKAFLNIIVPKTVTSHTEQQNFEDLALLNTIES